MVLGHEFVGIVEDVNVSGYSDSGEGLAVKERWQGVRVCGEINISCLSAECDVCSGDDRARARNHCPNRTCVGIRNHDGCHTEYLRIPVVNLFEVPSSLPDREAVFTEPLAAAFRIIEQMPQLKQAPHKIALIGDGKLGTLCAKVLAISVPTDSPHTVDIYGKHPDKLRLCAILQPSSKARGRTKCFQLRKADPSAEAFTMCRELHFDNDNDNGAASVDTGSEDLATKPLPTGAYDVVVDATGSPTGLELALRLVRTLGTLVLKSTCAAGTQFNTAPIVVGEVTILGSRCGPFDVALNALVDHKEDLRVTDLIEAELSLQDGEKAFALASTRGTKKVQLVMQSQPEPLE
eukprot:GFYU01004219.1.p1 GENE.GFYU01004219.1~~GFYU01004219.1.p1  ORF type:complete len:349 (-),score=99.85 GFYU01004219.1:6-1052(-)